ncbi:MAG: Clp protease N-terminal domain-containing protein, partial [Chloroflexota bacterium]
HLLLGLVREHESMAAGVLENLGVSLETLRAEVLKILGTDPRPNKRGRGTFGAPITPVPRG